MAGKSTKKQRQVRTEEETVARRQKVSQILFAMLAIFVILSMVISAFATY